MNSYAVQVLFANQDKRLHAQFRTTDPRLRAMVFETAFFLWETYESLLTITHIIRTQAKQDEIYGNDPKYVENPWKSVHQFNRGLDGVVSGAAEISLAVVEHINNKFIYDFTRPWIKSVLYHDKGYGKHLHFQVKH